jgi:hypothetical protein
MSVREICQRLGTNRLSVSVTAVVIGLVYLVAGILGDQTGFAIFGCALMFAIGALFWIVGRRSEVVASLSDARDERINALNGQASMVAGNVVLLACLAMFVVRIAQGHNGAPYSALAALGGVTYAAMLVWRLVRG